MSQSSSATKLIYLSLSAFFGSVTIVIVTSALAVSAAIVAVYPSPAFASVALSAVIPAPITSPSSSVFN